MSNLTLLQQETYTVPAVAAGKRIDLQGGADYFLVYNQTEAQANNNVNYRFWWYPNLNDGEAFVNYKAGGTDAVLEDIDLAGNFVYRTSVPAPEAAVAATAITQADGAVVTAATHGYAVGDKVRCENNVVMKNIAGMEFEITTVGDANTFTLGYLDTSGATPFPAAETSCNFRRQPAELECLPGARFITGISQAAAAVVTFSVAHDYTVGDVMYFRVPSDFAMVEMDGLQGKVTAVAASTVTVDIASTAFTAFAFPLAANVPQKWAIGAMAGKRGLYDDWFSSSRSLLDLNPYREGLSVPYMYLPAGSGQPGGSANDVITWQAWRQG